MSVDEYVATVKALIVGNSRVLRWEVRREEIQVDGGLFRYRVIWKDQSLLEMFERFEVVKEAVRVTKYQFHWQDAEGRFRKRWDNAPHHLEIVTHPHHFHDGEQVLPHDPVTTTDILQLISAWLDAHFTDMEP